MTMNLFLDPLNVRQGFTIVPNWIFSLSISAYEKLLLIALLSYARQKAGCYPGREKLAKDTSLSKRTLVEVVKDLKDKGLKMKRRGNRKTNYYTSPRYTSFKTEPPAEAKPDGSALNIEEIFAGLANELEANGLSISNLMAEIEPDGSALNIEEIFTGLVNE